MELLFVSSKVESSIAALEKAGKSGKNLAQKATSIIDSLVSGDVRHHMDAIESYTKYGVALKIAANMIWGVGIA